MTNIYNTEPTKFQLYNNNNHVLHNSIYGPNSGNGADLYFYKNFLYNNNNCYSNFPSTYKNTLRKGKSIFTGDFNNNNDYFKLVEIEVFKLSN